MKTTYKKMVTKKQPRGRPKGSQSFIQLTLSSLLEMREKGLIGDNTPLSVSRIQFENLVICPDKPLQGRNVLRLEEAESSTIQYNVC